MKVFQKDTKANNFFGLLLLFIGILALITRIISNFTNWDEIYREWNMNAIYLIVGSALLFFPWLTTKYQTRYWIIRLCGLGTLVLTFYKPHTALWIFMIICITLPFAIRSLEKGFLGKIKDKLLSKN